MNSAGIGENTSLGGLDVHASFTGVVVPAAEVGTGEQEAAWPCLFTAHPAKGRRCGHLC